MLVPIIKKDINPFETRPKKTRICCKKLNVSKVIKSSNLDQESNVEHSYQRSVKFNSRMTHDNDSLRKPRVLPTIMEDVEMPRSHEYHSIEKSDNIDSDNSLITASDSTQLMDSTKKATRTTISAYFSFSNSSFSSITGKVRSVGKRIHDGK